MSADGLSGEQVITAGIQYGKSTVAQLASTQRQLNEVMEQVEVLKEVVKAITYLDSGNGHLARIEMNDLKPLVNKELFR